MCDDQSHNEVRNNRQAAFPAQPWCTVQHRIPSSLPFEALRGTFRPHSLSHSSRKWPTAGRDRRRRSREAANSAFVLLLIWLLVGCPSDVDKYIVIRQNLMRPDAAQPRMGNDLFRRVTWDETDRLVEKMDDVAFSNWVRGPFSGVSAGRRIPSRHCRSEDEIRRTATGPADRSCGMVVSRQRG